MFALLEMRHMAMAITSWSIDLYLLNLPTSMNENSVKNTFDKSSFHLNSFRGPFIKDGRKNAVLEIL